jgi:hypothetical protein
LSARSSAVRPALLRTSMGAPLSMSSLNRCNEPEVAERDRAKTCRHLRVRYVT